MEENSTHAHSETTLCAGLALGMKKLDLILLTCSATWETTVTREGQKTACLVGRYAGCKLIWELDTRAVAFGRGTFGENVVSGGGGGGQILKSCLPKNSLLFVLFFFLTFNTSV